MAGTGRDETDAGTTTPGTASGGAAAAGNATAAGDAGSGDSGTRADDGLVVGADGLARPAWAASDPTLREYYDTEWGMPVRDEQGLFERISLEVFQSGLSWLTILRKREAFREAFDDFDPDAVAAFGDADVDRLMADAAIVRNHRKIESTIDNARATVALRADGGLAELVWSHRPDVTPEPQSFAEVPSSSPESVALAKALKAAGFRHVGPTTMFALMEAVGIVDTHLVGSHRRGTSAVWDPAG
ncbi:DNA-3-methyladenine glycosylase I [Georgenia sp. Z1344]|uniref:DNA-3-methyladenine glycosylase I n=1 Tax=Georgenia sp. Z1344 TaxID=3416706 RepID=UPI003CF23851